MYLVQVLEVVYSGTLLLNFLDSTRFSATAIVVPLDSRHPWSEWGFIMIIALNF